MSVVRISSPTPSIEEEIEEEQRLRKEEKQQMDADAGSSNEDSNEDSNSVAGTSSATSSVAGVAPRRGRSTAKKSLSTMLLGDDDDPKHVSLTVEAYYPPKEASNFAAQVLSLTGYEHPLRKEAVDIEYLKLLVSNDHCYTPLSSPTQKLPPRTLLDDADSSEECTVTTASKPKIDGSFVSQSVSAKGVDVRKPSSVKVIKVGPVAVSAAGSTPQNKLKKSTSAVGVTPPEQKKVTKPTKPVGKPAHDVDDEEEEDDDFDSEYSDEESSFSEEDDEMDADFSVSGRSTSKKRKQTAKSKVSPKTMPRAQYKKSDLKELNESMTKEGDKHKQGKVIVKSATPVVVKTPSQKSTIVKVEPSVKGLPVKKDAVRIHSSSSSSSGSTTPTLVSSNKQLPHGAVSGKVQTKLDSSMPKLPAASVAAAVASPAAASVPVAKKEKKPKTNPHDAALFSDMSALFSTPDIIKKVNANKPSTPSSISSANTSTSNVLPVTTTTTSLTTVKGPAHSTMKTTEQKQPVMQIQAPASATLTHPSTEQRLDLIDAIVQEDLRQPITVTPVTESLGSAQTTNAQPAEIPNIVKMLETPSNTVDTVGAGAMTAMLPEVKAIQPVAPAVDILPDTSILEALTSNDDALPEELLEHVAELAKNKELQEILDKQVLGVISPDGLLAPPVLPMGGGMTNLMPEQPIVQPTSNSVPFGPATAVPEQHNVNPVSMAPLTPNDAAQEQSTIQDQPAVQRKDAILIRRSDGRVITLPPIEAPTTRASKRRSQIGGSNTPTTSRKPTEQPPATVADSSETVAASDTPKLSRRQSVAKGVMTPSSSRPATPTAAMVEAGSLVEGKGEQKTTDDATANKRNSKVRQSVDSTRVKRVSSSNVAIAIEAAQDDDYESDESWNSEDDPDR